MINLCQPKVVAAQWLVETNQQISSIQQVETLIHSGLGFSDQVLFAKCQFGLIAQLLWVGIVNWHPQKNGTKKIAKKEEKPPPIKIDANQFYPIFPTLSLPKAFTHIDTLHCNQTLKTIKPNKNKKHIPHMIRHRHCVNKTTESQKTSILVPNKEETRGGS